MNWKGVCIYKEYYDNGNKPKNQRKTYMVKIIKKEMLEDNLIILNLLVPHKLAKDLNHPGSYVFIRTPDTMQFYDTPISVMDVDLAENIIKLAIEIKGIKTKTIDTAIEDSKVTIRGPFWNGVFGLKNVYMSKDGTSIIVAKGIGMAPMIPVIKKLYGNGNKIIVILDKAPYKNVFVDEYLKAYNCEVHETSMLANGELSDEFKTLLLDILDKHENTNLVHCDGADIFIYKLIELIGDKVKTSCCNNTKMCCGEGVCGACTVRYQGRKVKRLCKFQGDPKTVFEGRRFI